MTRDRIPVHIAYERPSFKGPSAIFWAVYMLLIMREREEASHDRASGAPCRGSQSALPGPPACWTPPGLKRMERLPFSGLSANLRLISYRLSNLFGGIALPKIPTPSAGATKRPEVDISRAARNRQLVDLEGRRSWGVALHQLTCQKSHVDHIAASKMQGIRLS